MVNLLHILIYKYIRLKGVASISFNQIYCFRRFDVSFIPLVSLRFIGGITFYYFDDNYKSLRYDWTPKNLSKVKQEF